jgi:hypothetical protein
VAAACEEIRSVDWRNRNTTKALHAHPSCCGRCSFSS